MTHSHLVRKLRKIAVTSKPSDQGRSKKLGENKPGSLSPEALKIHFNACGLLLAMAIPCNRIQGSKEAIKMPEVWRDRTTE